MTMMRLVPGLGLGFLLGMLLGAAPGDEGTVEVAGTVRTPDGKAAVGAVVESAEGWNGAPVVGRTDGEGRFRLRGVFWEGARLHARTEDGAFQGTRLVGADALSVGASSPVELTLARASGRDFLVTAGGRPAAGVRVVAVGRCSSPFGISGGDGRLTLLRSADDPTGAVFAWHPSLGVAAAINPRRNDPPGVTKLELRPTAPLKLRVVDLDGRPIVGLELGPSFRFNESSWTPPPSLDAAFTRTDAQGEAMISWAPREGVRWVGADFRGLEWRLERIDQPAADDRVVTYHARRRVGVEGALAMPGGARPEGLLVVGLGHGPLGLPDPIYARARADGTFRLPVCADHDYAIAVVDLRWAGEVWTGTPLDAKATGPAAITLPIHPATALTVVVTRGEGRDPVANAEIVVRSPAGVQYVLTTDRDGEARTGLGPGTHSVYVDANSWNEVKSVVVDAEKAVILGFHRD